MAGGFCHPGSLALWGLDASAQPELIREAERIRQMKFNWFALKDLVLPGAINYHCDYKSGKIAPKNRLSSKIDYRDYDLIGDIKYIWEPNRQIFLPILALAYHLTKDPAYLSSLEYYLTQWLDQNPYPYGVNWISSLELGIRLINWTIVWAIAGQNLSPALVDRWEKSALQHADHIDKYFSFYSSANNHLIGEAAGLYVASSSLLKGPRVEAWQKKAKAILCREIIKQDYSDGVNREQAFAYQQFVLDLFLIAAGFGYRSGDFFPDAYWARLEKMLEFTSSALSSQGEPFSYGDDDDGLAVDFLQKVFPGVYQSLLNTGAILFDDNDPSSNRSADHHDLKTAFFRNLYGYQQPFSSAHRDLPAAFPEGGYYFLGHDFGKTDEEKLMFDCGPLGYLSIAAHGHADALSFIYSAHGRIFFNDSGTFTYHGAKKWRDYFRGTAAHNTIIIDGHNQSQITGNFMWSRKAAAQCLAYIPHGRVSGRHDGYHALPDPVTHKRTIDFDENGIWSITDELTGKKMHQGKIMFHLHPAVSASAIGNNSFQLQREGITLFLQMDPALDCQIISGQENPPLGWYSPSYDVKMPSPVICGTFFFSSSRKLICSFQIIHKEESTDEN